MRRVDDLVGTALQVTMSTVNFIADPWEHSAQRRIETVGREWMSRYRAFRLRMHWLLLWNSEVRILDTFALFNRQFEHWVTKPYGDEGDESRSAKRKPLESGAIRIALRRGFDSLASLDDEMLRCNQNFIWYPDGKPNSTFAADLDTLLGLPSKINPAYDLGNHKQVMKKAFEESLTPYSIVSREFTVPGLSPEEVEQLKELIGDDWTRSRIYRVLGYGINGQGKFRKPLWKHALEHPLAADQLRRLADSCYHRAVHDDLNLPARFPGTSLPLSLDLMYPNPEGPPFIGIQPREADTLEFRQGMVSNTAVCLEGDVGALFQRFGSLSVHQVLELRKTGPFQDYHQLSGTVSGKVDAWDNPKLGFEVSKTAFECLRELGKACGISSIERVASSDVRLAIGATSLGASLLLTGLAVLLSDNAAKAIGEASPWLALLLKIGVDRLGNVGEKIISKAVPGATDHLIQLSARIRRVSPANPVAVNIQCAGDVELPHLANET